MDNSIDVQSELQELTDTLAVLDALIRRPQLQERLGDGLMRELRYSIASYRQCFPHLWPQSSSAQPALF